MKKKNSRDAYVLDTYALLAYYNDEEGVELVKRLLEKARQEDILLYLSEISIGEVYYTVAREENKQKANLLLDNLTKLPIEFIQAELQRILAAADYKSQGGLSYADCFVLATAREFNAAIVTGDPEFEKVKREFKIQWVERK